MKQGKKIARLVVCLLLVVCFSIFMLINRQTESVRGKIVYVYGYGRTADEWTYKLIEQDMGSGEQTILRENDSEMFLIDSPQGDMYCAVIDENEMLTVCDVRSGAAVWQANVSDIGDAQQDVFAFDGKYLYHSEDRRGDAEYVMRLSAEGYNEVLARIANDGLVWISCHTVSPEGTIAYMREERIVQSNGASVLQSHVCIYEKGAERVIAEGAYPQWLSEQELYFVQDNSLMVYHTDTAQIEAVRAENGEEIKLASRSLLTAPNPKYCEGYLVYTINTTGTSSMPNDPDIGVTSMKNGKSFRIKDVDTDQFGNQKIFVILD